MSKSNFARRNRLLLLSLALLLLLVGCINRRSGTSWADLSLIEVNESPAIMVAYEGYIVTVDPATGESLPLINPVTGSERFDDDGNPRIWEITRDGSEFVTTPIFLDDETLLIADYNNRLLQADFPNARVNEIAQIDLDGHVLADILVTEDRIYVPFSEQNLAAYDLESLEQLWVFPTERGVWASPILIEGVLYVVSLDHYLYAVDADSGESLWTLNLGGAIASTPVYHDGVFYIGTFDHKVFTVSLDGEILAEYEGEDWIWGAPVLYDGLLYVTDLGGYVFALDPSNDLEEIWKVRQGENGIRPSALVTEEFVIVADREGDLYWLDRATGEERFKVGVGDEVLSELLLVEPGDGLDISEPLVIVSTTSNNRVLVAYSLTEGIREWIYDR